MNIKVQKHIPSNNQGRPGEMVLVVHSSGMYLYVRGDNAWGSLRLSRKGIGQQEGRDKRRVLQENVRTIIEHDGTSVADDAEHGRGTVAGGGGGNSSTISSGPPDAPL